MIQAQFIEELVAVLRSAAGGVPPARVPPGAPSWAEQAILGAAINELLERIERREQSARRTAERLRFLADVAREFAEVVPDLPALQGRLARRLSEIQGDLCCVRLLDVSGTTFEARGAVHHPDPAILAAASLDLSRPQRVGEGAMGRVVATGEALLLPRIDAPGAAASSVPEAGSFPDEHPVTGVLIVPLKYGSTPLGAASLLRSDPDCPFTEDDLRLVESIAEHAALAIANARSASAERAARARFDRLSRSGILGIVVATLDGDVLDVNQALVDLVGHSREDLVAGRPRWSELTPPEWHANDRRAVEELASSGVTGLREKEYLRKDGTRVPVLVGSAALEDGGGRQTISFVLDVRRSKPLAAAVEHLREARASEATFRGFVDAAPDAVVVADRDGTIVLVNTQAERLFGYHRDELQGQPIDLLVPERHRTAHVAHRARYFEAPQFIAMGPRKVDLHGLAKDGREFPIEVSLGPVEMRGEILVASAIRDLSAWRATREQQVRLAAIVEASDDAIIGKTLEGVITSWNPGAEHLFGYSAEEILGQPIIRLIPEDRRQEEEEILKELGQGRVKRFETVRIRKDGQAIDVSVTSSPIRDAAGRLVGASKVVRDITERRRAERAVERARDAAEAANRELEAFSYSVAHDLRAPLRGMRASAQILLEHHREKLDADGQDWLGEIVAGAHKMGELIDALLSLARLSRGELRVESVSLSSIVSSVGHQLAAQSPERHVDLAIEPGLLADMDPVLARALVENLLGNAWKFTSKVAAARVEFGALPKQGERVFFLRDNGAGFDMAYAARLFAPFQRLHGSSDFPGTGIGLATVQRIVNRHGGRVWAEGCVDAGATFYFTVAEGQSPSAP